MGKNSVFPQPPYFTRRKCVFWVDSEFFYENSRKISFSSLAKGKKQKKIFTKCWRSRKVAEKFMKKRWIAQNRRKKEKKVKKIKKGSRLVKCNSASLLERDPLLTVPFPKIKIKFQTASTSTLFLFFENFILFERQLFLLIKNWPNWAYRCA